MLADCHIHMVLDGRNWRAAIARHRAAPDETWIRSVLAHYRAQGFGYLRDGGDRWGVGRMARQLAPEYGIVYRTPHAPLYHVGHYGALIGVAYADLREFAARAAEIRQRGGDFLKVMISGLMDFDRYGVLTEAGLPGAEIRELIHIAHGEGLAVMAHANGTDAVLAAADAGVDSVEHGAYLHPEALAAMVQSGVIWTPTLSTIGNLRGKGRFRESEVERILADAMENVQRYAAMGGLLAPGTDAGAWAVEHGMKTEYALLQQCLGSRTEEILARGIEAVRQRF